MTHRKTNFWRNSKPSTTALQTSCEGRQTIRRIIKMYRLAKKQRWSRECQRRGGTTQMFHLLSFAGRWDPSFFAKQPVPQQLGEQAEPKKQATRAAVEARAQLRLARKYDGLKNATHRCILISLHSWQSCTMEVWRRKPIVSRRYPAMGDSNEEMAHL